MIIHCLDVRVGVCYRSVKGGQCGMPLVGELFMKANCCCSSFSQAWGSPCEICPLKNSGKCIIYIVVKMFMVILSFLEFKRIS